MDGHYDHSTLCRTRPWVPEMGFLTTIQNMMEVAKLRAYLRVVSCLRLLCERGPTYQVKMYCVWLFLRLTVGALPMGIPFGSRS
jgi:hypothetical protein